MNKKGLLEFTTDDGNSFFIEVQDDPVSNEPMRGMPTDQNNRGVIKNALGSFETALKPLKEISYSIVNTIKEIANSPEEINVELGLKFSAKAGIILTSLDGEANLKIMMKWKKSETGK